MRFSVTIPAYKREYLSECIESVLSQTFDDFELVIVNDASPEDLDSVVKQYNDPRIRYYTNDKNCGALNVVDNWNKCLNYAKGDYVICMGDDDRLCPSCLEEYAKLIEKYPGIGLLHGWTEIIGEDSVPYQITAHRCEYESQYSLAWHRWNGYSQQFVGDFCYERKWLLNNGGFFKLPLAWGADSISAQIGASKNGVANTQVIVFQYRRSRQTISNTGSIEAKMDALIEGKNWYRAYLCQTPAGLVDQLFVSSLRKQLDSHFFKLKCHTISHDLRRHSLFRMIHWWKLRRKYQLSFKGLIYSFFLSRQKMTSLS